MPVIETSSQATFPGGVYRHRESGQELVAVETGKFGNPQAAAYVRMGFEYVGPVSEKALTDDANGGKPGKLTLPTDPFAQPEHNVGTTDMRSVGEIEADLAAAKAREADAARKAQASNLVEKKDVKENTPETSSTSTNEKKGAK